MKILRRYRYKKHIIVLFLFFGGCGTLNVSRNYLLNEKSNAGIVVVSMTQSEDQFHYLWYHYRSIDNSIKGRIPGTHTELSNDWRIEKGNPNKNFIGRIGIIELPAGEYEFYEWTGWISKSPMRWIISPTKLFSYKFKVIPGKALYIGNIDMRLNKENHILYIEIKRACLRIIDSRNRDLELIFNRYNNIKPENVIIDIISIDNNPCDSINTQPGT